ATGLPPDERRLLLIGIDPKDDPATARARIAEIWAGRPGQPGLLVAGDKEITELTGDLGYHYTYDRDTDSFAHPAA
ncbi:hypothetical protein, partial [Clostridium perfringens]